MKWAPKEIGQKGAPVRPSASVATPVLLGVFLEKSAGISSTFSMGCSWDNLGETGERCKV